METLNNNYTLQLESLFELDKQTVIYDPNQRQDILDKEVTKWEILKDGMDGALPKLSNVMLEMITESRFKLFTSKLQLFLNGMEV